jgi:hypothetical protein
MPAVTAEFAIPVELRLKDGSRERLQAHIARVSRGFLVISSRVPVDPTRKLDVLYLDRGIFSESVYCHPQPDGTHHIGARILEGTDGALRGERRIRLDVLAQLTTARARQSLPVRVIDMSSSGLGIKLDSPLQVGQSVYVELEHGVAFGEIRHCKKVDRAYRAGLFVQEFIERDTAPVVKPARSARKLSFGVAHALRTALLSRRAS